MNGSLEILQRNCQEAYNEEGCFRIGSGECHVTVVNREAYTCKLQEVKFVFLFGSLDDRKVWPRTGQQALGAVCVIGQQCALVCVCV